MANTQAPAQSAELFEITTIAARDEFTVELLNADESPLFNSSGARLSITVFGPGSKEYAAAQAARNARLMERMAKRGAKSKLSAEEQETEAALFLAACTKSFNGWAYKGDPRAFEACYRDRSLGFIADQVQRAIGDWANFSTGSVTS